ncbi:NAD-dependent succinate-semialdehyde dehydrogenase [Vreelandella venusta]|uniref:NAD-dependent succinate-semialdehyde dehydrogenase n=1 Tax=Vreelandella venusta TaxID=44935 RepID=A0AAP9ZBH9_9GAMM|nr:NAD-dependent succinate-semialdehyde dehydrogenase [Halomonas venusta]MBR9924123.1 NAD-dependent succinate-semialdehyde dehydrogenase [Gammaproteobacteria bacterium]AZM96497.1 NAD-dependent succinate-semialdehyde dehydrogenase [Halomonas venusta]NPT30195.1 succinate-semialdehyde dehydrogenase (NADP(+)) [Halomonas venusta]QRL02043.1 NAD-dependent succinate-semialdehyde dehydrogenase [Halomonas venusta]UQI39295.1 NAD-dependent succinate-semialdehyde dehydrogenase [Halomonas venusta]
MSELPDILIPDAFIGGEWCGADKRFAVTNPANGELLAEVPDLDADGARAAVAAAEAAGPSWKKRTAKERATLLRAWFDAIMAHQEDLARLMTLEQGKPLAESRGEVAYGASFVEFYAEESKRMAGETLPGHGVDKRILVFREPIGVVAAVTPWNFPLAMITRKCAPALAAGCTVVIKPAEATPLTALAVARLAELAGLPAGVINVVTASQPAPIGEVLTTDPRVRKFSFTGSTPVGKKLLAQCAGTVKKVSLELGGNAPFIVFDDADLDAAVEGAVASKYRNSGQTCVCTNRFLVQSGVYEAFVEKFAKRVAELNVGNGLDDGVMQGPLINQAAVEKVESHIGDALEKGGRLVCGGKPHTLGGTFFEPTIIADVTDTMRVAREETFGPLAPVFRFETDEEAIAMANATEFGLAAYFYARDYRRIWHVMEGLEYGMVAVNEGILSTELAPFGGVKESGLGREGSRHGLDEFTELKYVCVGGL